MPARTKRASVSEDGTPINQRVPRVPIEVDPPSSEEAAETGSETESDDGAEQYTIRINRNPNPKGKAVEAFVEAQGFDFGGDDYNPPSRYWDKGGSSGGGGVLEKDPQAEGGVLEKEAHAKTQKEAESVVEMETQTEGEKTTEKETEAEEEAEETEKEAGETEKEAEETEKEAGETEKEAGEEAEETEKEAWEEAEETEKEAEEKEKEVETAEDPAKRIKRPAAVLRTPYQAGNRGKKRRKKNPTATPSN